MARESPRGKNFPDAVHRTLTFNWGEIKREEFDRKGEELDRTLEKALAPKRRIRDLGNRSLLRELRWHYKRGSLLRHLKSPEMEPTNFPCGAGAASGGDRTQSVALLEERSGSGGDREVQERAGDG